MENLVTENIRIQFIQNDGYVDVAYTGFITYEQLVNAVQYHLKMVQHYAVRKVVVNLQKIVIYPEGGVDYIKTEWFPRITQYGVTHVAFIVPENVFAQLDMQAAHAEAEEKKMLLTKYFIEAAAALEWIKQF